MDFPRLNDLRTVLRQRWMIGPNHIIICIFHSQQTIPIFNSVVICLKRSEISMIQHGNEHIEKFPSHLGSSGNDLRIVGQKRYRIECAGELAGACDMFSVYNQFSRFSDFNGQLARPVTERHGSAYYCGRLVEPDHFQGARSSKRPQIREIKKCLQQTGFPLTIRSAEKNGWSLEMQRYRIKRSEILKEQRIYHSIPA